MVLESCLDNVDLECAALCQQPLTVRTSSATPETAPQGMRVIVLSVTGDRFKGRVVHVPATGCSCGQPLHVGVMVR